VAFPCTDDLAGTTCLVPSGICWHKHTYLYRKLSSLPHVDQWLSRCKRHLSTPFPGRNPRSYHRLQLQLQGSFNFEEECLNAAGREVDAFRTSSDSTSISFPATPSFLRIHDDGTIHLRILDGLFYPRLLLDPLVEPSLQPRGKPRPFQLSLQQSVTPSFQSCITSSSTFLQSIRTPTSLEALADMVTLFTESIQETMSRAMISTYKDRKILLFLDKQLDDLRKKTPC